MRNSTNRSSNVWRTHINVVFVADVLQQYIRKPVMKKVNISVIPVRRHLRMRRSRNYTDMRPMIPNVVFVADTCQQYEGKYSMKNMNIYVIPVESLLKMHRSRNFINWRPTVWKQTWITSNVVFVADILQQQEGKISMKSMNIFVSSDPVKTHFRM